MPSNGSRSSGAVRGKVTSTGSTLPVPQRTVRLGFAEICVWPWNSLALPVTRTTSPRLTESVLPLKTKMPSEVAESPSPVRSCR